MATNTGSRDAELQRGQAHFVAHVRQQRLRSHSTTSSTPSYCCRHRTRSITICLLTHYFAERVRCKTQQRPCAQIRHTTRRSIPVLPLRDCGRSYLRQGAPLTFSKRRSFSCRRTSLTALSARLDWTPDSRTLVSTTGGRSRPRRPSASSLEARNKVAASTAAASTGAGSGSSLT